MNALRIVLCFVLSVALALPAQATAFLSPAVKVHEPEDAFGNLTFSSGTTANMYRYAGEQYDADLGLYYNRARYLNPDSGRFWSMDSHEGRKGDPASLHKYSYAHANPVTFRDPSGHAVNLPGLAAAASAVTTLGSMAVPAIQRAPQIMNTVQRGSMFVNQLAATLMARGQVIVAQGSDIVDDLGQAIGRFRIDLLAQRAGQSSQQVNMLVEGKGVPWYLFGRPGSGWESYLQQLTKQAEAFQRAVQTQGQPIHERVIVFSSRAPAGLEKAWSDITTRIGSHYSRVFNSPAEFEKWLDTLSP